MNVDICCSSTIIYQIENLLNKRAVQKSCINRCQGSIATGVPINVHICCSSTVMCQKLRIEKRAVWSSCIIHCQSSIAIAVPIFVDICCSCTVLQQIERRLSKHAVQSQCIICCQGSIAIAVPINVDICCSLRSIGIGAHVNVDISCGITVVQQIENHLSECAQSKCTFLLYRFHCNTCCYKRRYMLQQHCAIPNCNECAVLSQRITRFQGSIAKAVPVNVEICCRSTVVYQIENQLSERAVQGGCIIHCQGFIAIAVLIMQMEAFDQLVLC